MTYFEPTIKCLSLTLHPSLRNTFSPRAKAFDVCTIVYTKDFCKIPYCLCNQQRALDHEGWAVGVVALCGYFISNDV